MFRFPRAKFASENDLRQQIGHAGSEFAEIIEAMTDMEPMENVAAEICDAIHSLETALRIMQERHGISVRDMIIAVEIKNRQRGYYDNH